MPDRYPVPNPRAAWRIYDGEAVIISPDDSTLHTLNPSATLVWEKADGRASVSDLAAVVADRFTVSREVASADLERFLETLAARGLLTVADAPVDDARESFDLGRIGDGPPRGAAYDAPAIVSEEIFETTALACGKITGGSGLCRSRPMAS